MMKKLSFNFSYTYVQKTFLTQDISIEKLVRSEKNVIT